MRAHDLWVSLTSFFQFPFAGHTEPRRYTGSQTAFATRTTAVVGSLSCAFFSIRRFSPRESNRRNRRQFLSECESFSQHHHVSVSFLASLFGACCRTAAEGGPFRGNHAEFFAFRRPKSNFRSFASRSDLSNNHVKRIGSKAFDSLTSVSSSKGASLKKMITLLQTSEREQCHRPLDRPIQTNSRAESFVRAKRFILIIYLFICFYGRDLTNNGIKAVRPGTFQKSLSKLESLYIYIF